MIRAICAMTVCGAVLAAVGGCASTPSPRYYTLSSDGAQTAVAAQGPTPTRPPMSALPVSVGPVTIPALLDRPQMVISAGPNRVTFDEFNRWASPLQDNLARVVADNLGAMLGSPGVSVYPQLQGGDEGYRVAIDLQSLESMPGTSVRLDALWTLRRMPAKGWELTRRTTAVEPVAGSSYDALVAAESRAVTRLSRDIADAIQAQSAASH